MEEQPPSADPGARPEPDRTVRSLAADPGVAAPTLPSPLARVVAFVAVLLAGAAGGFIGYAVTDLQCSGDCTVPNGIGGLVGAVLGAVGVGIVVQLALKAMHEWRTVEARGDDPAPRNDRRPPPAGGSRPRPRVQ